MPLFSKLMKSRCKVRKGITCGSDTHCYQRKFQIQIGLRYVAGTGRDRQWRRIADELREGKVWPQNFVTLSENAGKLMLAATLFWSRESLDGFATSCLVLAILARSQRKLRHEIWQCGEKWERLNDENGQIVSCVDGARHKAQSHVYLNYVHSKLLRLHFQPFGSTPTTFERRDSGARHKPHSLT